MTIDPTEFYKLTELLRDGDVPYQTTIHQYAMGTHYGIAIPSISFWNQHKGLHIAINPLTGGHKSGLLEMWDGNKKHEPVYCLTAEKAYELVKEGGW